MPNSLPPWPSLPEVPFTQRYFVPGVIFWGSAIQGIDEKDLLAVSHGGPGVNAIGNTCVFQEPSIKSCNSAQVCVSPGTHPVHSPPAITLFSSFQKVFESDWTQVADSPVNSENWAAYRQQLRDITKTQTPYFENEMVMHLSGVTWPQLPNLK